MASRMPFEIEDFPLPGGPYIRIDRPEDTAGPRWSRRSSGRIRWPIASMSCCRVIWMLRIDWRLTCSVVDLKRHGHGAVVFRLPQRVERAGLARFGQLVAHLAARVGVQRARRLEKLLAAGDVDEFLRDRDRQADRLGEFGHPLEVHAEHRLDQDVPHHHRRKEHLLEPAGRRRGHHVGGLHVHGVVLSPRFSCRFRSGRFRAEAGPFPFPHEGGVPMWPNDGAVTGSGRGWRSGCRRRPGRGRRSVSAPSARPIGKSVREPSFPSPGKAPRRREPRARRGA
jgi:hypothetical protein